MIVIDNKFSIGEIVYLRTDEEQHQRIVTEFKIMSGNLVFYGLNRGLEFSFHTETEISRSKVLQL